MQEDALARWRHDHSFGQDRRRPGERKTQLVIAITATMMVVEIAAGVMFGSMALLADGLHMASHAVALGINAYAYAYARRHAHDASYSFGTGKVNTLGGFTGAVLLAAFRRCSWCRRVCSGSSCPCRSRSTRRFSSPSSGSSSTACRC